MKAGTTALYYISKQHPQIFMSPIKEPNFFAMEGLESNIHIEGEEVSIKDWFAYLELYKGVENEHVIGEASHSYLYFSTTPNKLCHKFPESRLVCILRNPVDRAFSHFLYHLRDGREPIIGFERALKEEETRIDNNILFGHYFHRGLYYNQLQRYFEVFDPHQVMIFLFEDLQSDPAQLAADLYRFLDVDVHFEPETLIIRNPSGIPKNKFVHRLLVKPNPIKSIVQPILPQGVYQLVTKIRDRNLIKPELSTKLRSQIVEMYKDDIFHLQDLIQRDLSAWLG
jgi:hypothetical protein